MKSSFVAALALLLTATGPTAFALLAVTTPENRVDTASLIAVGHFVKGGQSILFEVDYVLKGNITKLSLGVTSPYAQNVFDLTKFVSDGRSGYDILHFEQKFLFVGKYDAKVNAAVFSYAQFGIWPFYSGPQVEGKKLDMDGTVEWVKNRLAKTGALQSLPLPTDGSPELPAKVPPPKVTPLPIPLGAIPLTSPVASSSNLKWLAVGIIIATALGIAFRFRHRSDR